MVEDGGSQRAVEQGRIFFEQRAGNQGAVTPGFGCVDGRFLKPSEELEGDIIQCFSTHANKPGMVSAS
jgi:hypothetical protein